MCIHWLLLYSSQTGLDMTGKKPFRSVHGSNTGFVLKHRYMPKEEIQIYSHLAINYKYGTRHLEKEMPKCFCKLKKKR